MPQCPHLVRVGKALWLGSILPAVGQDRRVSVCETHPPTQRGKVPLSRPASIVQSVDAARLADAEHGDLRAYT